MPTKLTAFSRYTLLVLAANLGVILWGAFVRASGSGAGCGNHWPLCNGEVVPIEPGLNTIIEFGHRLTSGAALLMVIGLVVWAFRAFPRRHPARMGAGLSLVFIIGEALIGAGLVLFELVAQNASVARAYWMAAHLVNTFFLLGAITLTAWWGAGGAGLRLRRQGTVGIALFASLLAMLLLGASGAVTALGDTLLLSPNDLAAASAEALAQRRLFHPIIAISVGLLVTGTAVLVARNRRDPGAQLMARTLVGLFLLQLAAGGLNVSLQAPIWLQLTHLLLADAVWIAFVLLTATALAAETEVELPESSRALVTARQTS